MDIVGLKGLFRWLRHERGFHHSGAPTAPSHIKTSYSSTVFTGESADWVSYLDLSRQQRYDPAIHIDIVLDKRSIQFIGRGETSSELARHLRRAQGGLEQSLEQKPFVFDQFRRLVFHNAGNQQGRLALRVSSVLPCEASREIALEETDDSDGASIVLGKSMVQRVLKDIRHAGKNITDREHLGLFWPVLRRVVSQLGYPNDPRDRFVEKIDLTVSNCLLAIHVLYEGKRAGRLVPNQVGELYERYVARRDGMRREELFDRHPYFRLINELGFMFDESSFRAHTALAQVLVREYLDGRYLRLSLAGIMPEVDATMAPMPHLWQKHRISTPYPRLRRYGILDDEDLSAWRKVEGPFRDMGLTLIRQLGIGQFGRVYEACNQFNPHLPRHVAVKIDRIIRGKKKEAIQSAEATMRIGEDLSTAPHVIRVFDAGKLKGKRYTYHVLQMVDGDTLDNLVGISGIEHSSMLRPRTGQRSEREVQREYLKAIKASTREIWRRQRMTRPFLDPLNLSQALDLLTSILLWLEEIHRLHYAVNDLKNGNLMISRRGQLKGIDLDAYSRITDPMDRATDFFFLAVSLLLLLLNIKKARDEPMTGCEGLLHSRDALWQALTSSWPFGDVSQISAGRVETVQVMELLVDLIQRSRDHSYTQAPDLFTDDIDRLITLKRVIFGTEIVLD